MAGYLGDKLNMIVHHLAVMKPECKIYEIKKKNRHYFIPDTFVQANSEEYTNCVYCIKDIQE